MVAPGAQVPFPSTTWGRVQRPCEAKGYRAEEQTQLVPRANKTTYCQRLTPTPLRPDTCLGCSMTNRDKPEQTELSGLTHSFRKKTPERMQPS